MASQPGTFKLNRAARMQAALGRKVGGVRVLWRVEAPNLTLLSRYADNGHPLAAPIVPLHAQKATECVGIGSAQVLPIYGLRNIAQVGKTVVAPDSVDMVDLVNGPVSSDIKPCQPMGEVVTTVDGDGRVSIARKATRRTAARRSASWHLPQKHAGLGVVVQEFAQTLRGKIGRSHDALQLLIGQRPASVSALGGLRHFSLEQA